jgi:hypothetical protein
MVDHQARHDIICDPEFYVQLAIRLMPDSMQYEPTKLVSGAYPGALMTSFNMSFFNKTVMHSLPMQDALLLIPVSCEASIATAFFVLPMENALVSANVESLAGEEHFSGVFISCSDPFSLDALSEMYAAAQRRTAQSKIVEKAALLLTPLLASDTAAQLADALGSLMRPAMAAKFSEAFTENLVVASKFAEAGRHHRSVD